MAVAVLMAIRPHRGHHHLTASPTPSPTFEEEFQHREIFAALGERVPEVVQGFSAALPGLPSHHQLPATTLRGLLLYARLLVSRNSFGCRYFSTSPPTSPRSTPSFDGCWGNRVIPGL